MDKKYNKGVSSAPASVSERKTNIDKAFNDEEDISIVAEKITSSRRYIPEADTVDNSQVLSGNDVPEPKESKDKTVPGSLFAGFTAQKAVGNFLVCLAAIALLLAAAAAAVKMSNDKVVRTADFEMVSSDEDIETAKNNSQKNKLPENHTEYEIKESDPDNNSEQTDGNEEKQYKITLHFYGRDDIELFSTKTTVNELFEKSGLTLIDGEELSVPGDTVLAADTTVNIDKIEYTTDVIAEPIPYETEERQTDLIPRGTVNYIQYGKEGTAETTYMVKLKNGEEVSREVVETVTTQYPQNEIYDIGVGGSFVGNDGVTYSYSYKKTVKATYYYLPNDPYTYLGNHPDKHTIAVDPGSIPLGTWVYVKNSKYDFGIRQAQDIGGAVKGDMIDIWLEGNEPGYSSFVQTGIHYDMEVYFVD